VNELIGKDMTQKGVEGLAGWFRTTWLPYLDRLPERKREEFIAAVVSLYVSRFPIDTDGLEHVKMVRLEVEAENP
jgi:trans-aconitate methyltransferase